MLNKKHLRAYLLHTKPVAWIKKRRVRNLSIFWHTLSKSIRRASFFEIDPWFSVGGQTYPLAMMGAKSCPRSFGLPRHACKRIYVVTLVFSKLPIGINQISFFVHIPRVCKQIKQILCGRVRNVFFIVFCHFPKFAHRILSRELLKRGSEL